ncbi:GTP-binding protein [Fluoribacter gormanii]|uniref:Ras-related protein Rab-1A n=1 Tax=Fluoribacter gormanii TaxID=464 RepID=A0A377GNC1_9GAMM|nr:Rab family GTPase [Fluoribacter gormanii]KTD04722.1 Ras family GTPase [Fluoribacter gormanii]MCW8470563.1 GTP-binding protein [Fluoribacter gormanii]SIR14404.1 Ras-related protein Rab-1A [Fluoribacter gormanii]STO26278.1 Ribosomal protein L23 [Fluoribacter gormanii]
MEQKQEYDEHFKIILLGNNAVGKSCLLRTYCDRTPCFDEYMDTMGVDQEIKPINVFNKRVLLRIWDSSGAPKLQNIVASYFRFVDGALICFDLANRASLSGAKEHVARLRTIRNDIPIVLVGCKSDLKKRREVTSKQAKELADELGSDYLEVSALNDMNVEQLFTQITLQIYLSKQLNKIKPTLDKCFNNFLKLNNPNRAKLFTEQHQSSPIKGEIRAEYRAQFAKLFVSRRVDEVTEFCRKTLDLIEKTNYFYKQESPVLSSFLTSPLSNALKDILDVLNSMLGDMMGFTAANELIYQKKSIEHAL